MKLTLLCAIAALLLAWNTQAQPVNFSEHIAPIIYQKCTSCHRQGEVAPMPLTNYDEVKSWRQMVKYVTSIRYMPPWKPDPKYQTYLGENYLTDAEIDLIAKWVDDGAPQGNPMKEPALPYFPDGSQLGTPDLVLPFAQAYEHKGINKDEYRIFVLPTGLTEDKEIAAVEIRPGNRNIVHHALFSYDTSGKARENDDADAEYGYQSFGGFGVTDNPLETIQFPGYVPGQKPRFFPEGLGQVLPAGADFLVQMHYAPIPTAQKDSSVINIFFKKEPIEREVQTVILVPLSNIITDGPFVIPPRQVRSFHGQITTPRKLSLVSISPHMHLLGKKWEVFAVTPNRQDTIPLIRINDWDFNWQGTYTFERFVVLEAGSVIHATATYDNTSDNPFNPNNPPKWVGWGEKTTDEMYYLPISFVEYKEGDEDILFTETETTAVTSIEEGGNKLQAIFPNPTRDKIQLQFELTSGSNTNIQILDLQGRVVLQNSAHIFHPVGKHQTEVEVKHLPEGMYFIRLIGDSFQLVQSFVLVK